MQEYFAVGAVTHVVMGLVPPVGMVALVTMVDTVQDVASLHLPSCLMQLKRVVEPATMEQPVA